MVKYRNKESGVESYEIGDDYIKVKFKTSPNIYHYTYSNPGKDIVERMKLLALRGKGLSTLISQLVGDNYDTKS